MQNRKFLVLLQYRTESAYNDFIGKFYHFPKKYKKLLSENKTEFIYYEPLKNGEGVYFGCGKLGKIFEDKREADHYFVEINDYKEFVNTVSFRDENGNKREIDDTYNATNAVRRISPEIFEGICLDGGILLNFKADAHLIKVLGEQLIASEKVGFLELIKNAYDANATKCTITIEKAPSLPETSPYKFDEFEGPVIVFEDNGIGMDRYTFEHGWLRPASPLKTNIKERLKEERKRAIESGNQGTYDSLVEVLKKEHNGRIPLGEKGVGRFATHRLGKKLNIQTKTAALDYELNIDIDWDKFDRLSSDSFVNLDSIGVRLKRQKPSRDYGETNSGTRFIIYGGREGYELTENIIRDIHETVLSLKSPQKAPNSFDVQLECPQVELDEEALHVKIKPNFTFDFLVDETGIACIEGMFIPPKSIPMPQEPIKQEAYDLKKGAVDYWRTDNGEDPLRAPECGPFLLHIDIWYRAKPWVDGVEVKEISKYLDRFGGISIFRDGLNVFPAEWGATTDWLGLKARHIKRGKRLSYYNMIGNLEVEQTKNFGLTDKTDREGMLQNVAFKDLSELACSAVLFAENYFMAKREAYEKLMGDIIRDPKILRNATGLAASVMKNISESDYEIEDDPLNILAGVGVHGHKKEGLVNLEKSLKNLQKSIEIIKEVQDSLTEHAGFGLSVAFSIHEIAKITGNFYNGISKLLKSQQVDRVKLEEIMGSAGSLRTELRRLGPLRAVRSEYSMCFNVSKTIDFTYAVFKNKLEKLGIDFMVNQNEDFHIYGRYGTLNQILSNLIVNSIYWMNTIKIKNKKIKIQLNKKERTIIVADNGPGIDDSIRKYLFEPGYSLRVPPSGLGLYVCKYYMTAMNGDIYETTLRERITDMSGAQFTLDFSRTPKDAEAAR